MSDVKPTDPFYVTEIPAPPARAYNVPLFSGIEKDCRAWITKRAELWMRLKIDATFTCSATPFGMIVRTRDITDDASVTVSSTAKCYVNNMRYSFVDFAKIKARGRNHPHTEPYRIIAQMAKEYEAAIDAIEGLATVLLVGTVEVDTVHFIDTLQMYLTSQRERFYDRTQAVCKTHRVKRSDIFKRPYVEKF